MNVFNAQARSFNVNFDILAILLAFLNPTSLVAAMGTCRSLYIVGVRHLVRDIRITTSDALASFYTFVALSDATRLRHIHAFDFAVERPSDDDLDILFDLLSRTNHLTSLAISSPGVLEAEEGLGKLIARIPTLKRFSISVPVWLAALQDILDKMEAPLESLDVADVHLSKTRQLTTFIEPTDIPLGMAWGLQELAISLRMFDKKTPSAMFPGVRKLTLYGCDSMPLCAIVRLFPAVRELYLRFSNFWTETETPEDHIRRRDAEKMRQWSLDQPDRVLWSELDVLEGPGHILYAWAVTLPVRAVRITDEANDPAIAVDTKPLSLRLNTDVGDIVSARHNPSLRELTVDVAVGYFVTAPVLRGFTAHIFDMLQDTGLVALRVLITQRPSTPSEDANNSEQGLTQFLSCHDFNIAATAESGSSLVPSLRALRVTVESQSDDSLVFVWAV
ncbi:hypothetical protein PsYK624_162940 [Phanerochaete sordida]|uniref:Uncharacterized protein n=1 Tax=Phanerochaete sordida TaxID=48140 RepID=A0A9P3LLY8_9APHY|nr:hypothetical protein PsYK624_162940 [Phanerochaete sordida]